jgi:uncharacterized membrane protein
MGFHESLFDALGQRRSERASGFDPIRLCVFATVALLAWLLGAPVMMMAMSALGIWGYVRAMRAGLTKTKCVLGDPRIVLVYLALIFVAGAAAAAWPHLRR